MSGLVMTRIDYDAMLFDVGRSHVIAVDTETTGLHPYTVDDIRGLSVGGQTGTIQWEWYLPLSHPDSTNFDPAPLMVALRDKQLVFHHGLFDWPFLEQVAVDVDWAGNTVWDTQCVNWLMDENLKIGLKESCERILGIDAGDEKRHLKTLMKAGYTWHSFTANQIGAYAAKDARLTYDLYNWQVNNLHNVNPQIPLAACMREVEVQRSLHLMIGTGVKVDPERILEGEGAFMEKVHVLETAFSEAGVNPNSPKQVAGWLFDKCGWVPSKVTPSGARSTDKNVLEDLSLKGCKEATALLEYRHLAKAVTGYFRPLHTQIGQDGRIHPAFSSVRTVTGRFSCSSPNLQTIPRDDTMPEVRRCFVAEDGWKLYGFDLAQAELRVIAGFANEPAMIEALEEGRDLHSETAASIFGPDFTPLQRRLAKNLNFGFAYGIGPAKFATYINPVPSAADVEMARYILNGYRKTYPRVSALLDGMERVAKKHGFVPSHVPGRFRHYKGAGYHKLPPHRKPLTYTAVNFIVQGGIGEFMKDVMNRWYKTQRESNTYMPVRLVLQVHDEFVFEVAKPWVPNADMVKQILQGISDDLSPFKMRMLFETKEWSHDA